MSREFVLQDEIAVYAPIERCFLLSTSLAIVQRELKMHPVAATPASRISGLAQAGDVIRWEGMKFGLPQFHESLINPFDPPVFFRDTMIAGRFRTFQHDHRFIPQPDGAVLLRDEIRFTMHWGALGALAGRLLLVPHIRAVLRRRMMLLKDIAQTGRWQEYL